MLAVPTRRRHTTLCGENMVHWEEGLKDIKAEKPQRQFSAAYQPATTL